MGGAAIAAQQPGPAQQEHPGADGAKAPGTAHGVRQPALDRRQGDVIGPRATGHQQQVDGFRQVFQTQVGHHFQPA
ncbi:hypothetical protein D3C71_2061600 [compost metagenome]